MAKAPQAAPWTKLGLIAGAGDLPLRLAQHCQNSGIALHVSRITGVTDAAMKAFPGAESPLAAIGERIKALKADKVDALVFAGLVNRPDFSALKPDWRGAMALPGIIAEARKGDDALLRAILAEFEKDGFVVLAPDDVLVDLLAEEGLIAGPEPRDTDRADIDKALEISLETGRLDIGQGAIVCDGLVLAVEAQEGTDRMLARVAELSTDIRGTKDARRGVLCKRAKPQQERRIDLPTIGLRTIEGAARAGLAGIVVEAGGALIIDRPAVQAAASEAGLFVLGVRTDQAIPGS
jgi:UDP-2,3-diacylglucosamine hydrolase